MKRILIIYSILIILVGIDNRTYASEYQLPKKIDQLTMSDYEFKRHLIEQELKDNLKTDKDKVRSYQLYNLKIQKLDNRTYHSEYQLPDKYMTKISKKSKDQGDCGACWAFTLVGSMESHILNLSNNYDPNVIDLSEQQLISGCIFDPNVIESDSTNPCFDPNRIKEYNCSGGSADAAEAWKYFNPIFESHDSIIKIVPFKVEKFWYVPTTELDIKKSIFEDGTVYFAFDLFKDFVHFWYIDNDLESSYLVNSKCIMSPKTNYLGGHSVLLIGWDDSRQSFRCKNSWGINDAHPEGSFWMSYHNINYNAKVMHMQTSNFSIIGDVKWNNFMKK